jgi:hypothetical protein
LDITYKKTMVLITPTKQIHIGRARGTGGAAVWTPAELASTELLWWTDFTDESTVTLESGTQKIEQVDDKSGNAKHLTQAVSGSRPLYHDGSLGYKAGDFTIGQQLIAAGITQDSDAYLYMVWKVDVTICIPIAGSGSQYPLLMWDGSTSTAYNRTVGSPTYQRNGSPVTLVNRNDAYDQFGGANVIFEADNISFASSGFAGNWRLGNYGGSFYLDGDVYECVILSNTSSAEDRSNMITYLKSKYSL